MKLSRLFPAVLAVLLLAGCVSYKKGPVTPPDPNARNEVRGVINEPAPIRQKNTPPGESPLRHDKPDQRIDKPTG